MEQNVFTTLQRGERVTSSYAEIYHDDDYCDKKYESKEESTATTPNLTNDEEDIWVSPSDLLIGIIELKPPFTSKLTRGKTHEGILAIGGEVLQKECDMFMAEVTGLLHDNDAAWSNILTHEKEAVEKKVDKVYEKIFQQKSETMKKEISTFYESSLGELEKHMKTEVKSVLISTYGRVVEEMNKKIKKTLAKEKKTLEAILLKRYNSEIAKVKDYYHLLFENEFRRNRELIKKSIIERNDALKAFYKQIESENITSTMYIMCLERKKCKIRKFILQSYQDMSLKDIMDKIKHKEHIIEEFRKQSVHIADINREWEEKIEKITKLFMKLISFSMKLLPEQTTFLLDLQKMVILQLEEMQRKPQQVSSILVSDDNLFKFEAPCPEEPACDEEPFVIVGDTAPTPPPVYGSTESLAFGVDLPFFRLDRQYLYAKCHKFEEIKKTLVCKCKDERAPCMCPPVPSEYARASTSSDSKPSQTTIPLEQKESSDELLIIDDVNVFKDCPARLCNDWVRRSTFPYLNEYLDFSEEKYERVKTLLGKPEKLEPLPEFLDPNDIVQTELPFSPTKEKYHTIATQYSSQESVYEPELECPCVNKVSSLKFTKTKQNLDETKLINEITRKRRVSLMRLLKDKPNLLKMFTDESFDFVL